MMAMRRAHSAYTAAAGRLEGLKTTEPRLKSTELSPAEAALLAAIEGGLDHGLGVLNLVMGMLPPKVGALALCCEAIAWPH